jgi:anti-sigma regulatory factor (Ser/Thr protein kinase)
LKARREIGGLAAELDGEVLDDLRLLVTELVTNSVRHAGNGWLVGLDVFLTEHRVRIEVSDWGGGFTPRPRSPGQSAEGGWGLHLVDRIADRWGVLRDHQTLVWLEIDLPARP